MHKRKRHSAQAGFTIPELLVTIVFLGTAATAIALLFIGIQDIQRRTSKLESATQAAQTEVESLRNNNYNQLVTGENIDFSSDLPDDLPKATGTVVVSEPQAGLKRVDVTVSYDDKGTTREVKLSSLIGVIGISQ